MPSPKLKHLSIHVVLGALALLLATTAAWADGRERVRIAAGRSEVVLSNEEVRTVAIAEPKIADAAVGSQRSVVVSGKTPGITTLVVYGEGGRFNIYDIEVYAANSDKQVALHVRVAEVTEDAKRQLGWDFYAKGTKGGFNSEGGLLTGKVTPIGVQPPPLLLGPVTDGKFSFTNKPGDLQFESAWQALEEKGAIRVLANPTLLASSGDSASFLAGGEIPIPIASSSGTGGSTVTIMWREYGVKIAFRPWVQDDGSILLNVSPEVSQLDFDNALRFSDAVIPALLTRKTMTTVQLKSGENLVIGGLKQTVARRHSAARILPDVHAHRANRARVDGGRIAGADRGRVVDHA